MLDFSPSFAPDRVSSLLCFAAHSDDIEIGAGATVLNLLATNPSLTVDWVVLSASDERAAEAQRSLDRVVGSRGKLHLGGFRESYFPYQPEIKDFVSSVAAKTDPDLVLAPWHDDAHQDHRVTAELVLNSFRDHLVAHYEIPKYDGDFGRPNAYVWASEAVVSEKISWLFDVFASQTARDWFTEDLFRGLMRVRGMECRSPSGYAEAFHVRKMRLL